MSLSINAKNKLKDYHEYSVINNDFFSFTVYDELNKMNCVHRDIYVQLDNNVKDVLLNLCRALGNDNMHRNKKQEILDWLMAQ